MIINLATLAFGYKILDSSGTPNWATPLGQGDGHKILNDPQIDEILRGMIYSSIPLEKVSAKLGKGGKTITGSQEESPLVLAALFKKVYLNETLIEDGKFILLITRDATEHHNGRLQLKYSISATYNEKPDTENLNTNSNKFFWDKAKEQLKLNKNSCFFVYEIRIRNQDELIFSSIVVNEHETQTYKSTAEMKEEWKILIDKHSSKTRSQSSMVCENPDKYEIPYPDLTRHPREQRIHPLNSIVYGAPGTGKTYSMVEYALAIIEDQSLKQFQRDNTDRAINLERYKKLITDGQVAFITFHQNYGYEEFIQGLRPDKDSETMTFKMIDGIFKRIADRAIKDTENKKYVIIIDEINRANISKVFGELITLIEEDKRWGEINEMSATLQSNDIFAVPNNLYIIGTMNSADKSISLIDTALRRRFDFIEQKPDSSLIKDQILKKALETLNLKLIDYLQSTDLLIGHSYFINKTEKDLCNILNNNIIPLLYEYFYDKKEKVKKLIREAMESANANIEIEDDSIGRIRVKFTNETVNMLE